MLATLEMAAIEAGKAILAVYHAGAQAEYKTDGSPVTQADHDAEAIILAHLNRIFPDIPVVAEESRAAGHTAECGDLFFLVDPLDGTKEFINRGNDFTVNIALVRDGVPVAGIVYAPARQAAYVASDGQAEKIVLNEAFEVDRRYPIRVRPRSLEMVAVASRFHNSPETETFLASQDVRHHTSVGSSLKFCLVAEGEADVYPRFGRTMEWDTAAGDAVLRAAGGRVVDLDGMSLRYGKTGQVTDSDFANPHFIAWGGDR